MKLLNKLKVYKVKVYKPVLLISLYTEQILLLLANN